MPGLIRSLWANAGDQASPLRKILPAAQKRQVVQKDPKPPNSAKKKRGAAGSAADDQRDDILQGREPASGVAKPSKQHLVWTVDMGQKKEGLAGETFRQQFSGQCYNDSETVSLESEPQSPDQARQPVEKEDVSRDAPHKPSNSDLAMSDSEDAVSEWSELSSSGCGCQSADDMRQRTTIPSVTIKADIFIALNHMEFRDPLTSKSGCNAKFAVWLSAPV